MPGEREGESEDSPLAPSLVAIVAVGSLPGDIHSNTAAIEILSVELADTSRV